MKSFRPAQVRGEQVHAGQQSAQAAKPSRTPQRRTAGRSAPAASSAEPAERTPANRYAGIFHSQTGGFSTGLP
jgi:hypothetical protein